MPIKKARNELNSLIKSAKARYYNDTLNQCKKDPKAMWKTINQLTNKKSKTTNINELVIDQKVITEPEKIADSLNTNFNEIGSVLAKDLPKGDNSFEKYIVPVEKKFEINRLSPIEVKNIILKLNSSKATGYDRISPNLLKDTAEIIAESLTVIFNKSIETDIFPDELRCLACLPYIKEKAKQNWYINMDKGLVNGIIFLDLKKAFDCVDHNILTKKLMKFGCIGNTLNWFKSYLTNRKQMCKVNQTTSKCQTISCGVPLGSNLGPILFLLYVNDLPNCLKSTSASMFADDTNLTASGNTITELHNKLNNDLENIHQMVAGQQINI